MASVEVPLNMRHYWFQTALDDITEGIWYIPYDDGAPLFRPGQGLKWSIWNNAIDKQRLLHYLSPSDLVVHNDDDADVIITTAKFHLITKFGKWYGKVVWIVDGTNASMEAQRKAFHFDGIIAPEPRIELIQLIRSVRVKTVYHWSSPEMPKHYILWRDRLKMVYMYERPWKQQVYRMVSPSLVCTIKYLERAMYEMCVSKLHLKHMPHPTCGNDVCAHDPWRSWVLQQQRVLRSYNSLFKNVSLSRKSSDVASNASNVEHANAANASNASGTMATTQGTNGPARRHQSL